MADRSENLALRLLIQARDGASGVLGLVANRITAIAAAMAGLLGMRSLAAWLTDAVAGAGALERQLSILRQVSGASADEMARIQAAAEAGASVAGTAARAAEAQVELAKAGQNAAQVLASLPGVLNLVAAEQLSGAESAGLVTQVLAGFGLEANQAARAANTLVAGAQASKTSAKGLGDALSYAAPMARAAGMSLESVVAAMGIMANGGIDASRAGTALQSILAQLGDPASTAAAALRAMGVVSTDLETVLARLAQGGPAAERAIAAFGLEAGPGLRTLVSAGAAGIEELRQRIAANTTASADAAQAVRGGLLGALETLAATWASVKAKVGEGLLTPLAAEVRALNAQLAGWLASGQAKAVGESLAQAFGAAARAVGEWVRSMDLRAILDAIVQFAQGAGAAIDTWTARLDAMATGTRRILDGVSAVWLTFRASVEGVASIVGTALSGMLTIADGAARGAGALGLLSQEAVARVSAAAEIAKDAAARAADASVQHYAEAGQAAVRAAGRQEQAAATVTAAVQKQAKAAGITADQLDRLGDAAGYAAEGQAALAPATEAAATAADQAAEASRAEAAAQAQIAEQARAAGVEILSLDTATGKLTAATIGSAAATRDDAAAKAQAAAKAKEEAAALQLLIDQQRAAGEATGRGTALIEQQSQARITHIQHLVEEARARGDLTAAAELESRLASTTIEGARAVAEARKAEAEAARVLAESLAQQAEAQQLTDAASLAAVAAARDDAVAKKLAAEAAEELVRHERALKDAKEQATAATEADTDATTANTAARQGDAAGGDGRLNDELVDRRPTFRTSVAPPSERTGVGRGSTLTKHASGAGETAAMTSSGSPAPIIINLSVQGQDALRLAASARGGRVSNI